MSDNLFIVGMSEADLKYRGVPEGMPTVSFPFANFGDNTTKLIRQRYRCLAPGAFLGLDALIDSETARAAGVNADDYFLVEESAPLPVCAGVVEVDRSWTTVPLPHFDFTSQIITYPAFASDVYSETSVNPSFSFHHYDSLSQKGYFFVGTSSAGKRAKVSYERTQTVNNSTTKIQAEIYANIDANGYFCIYATPYATTLAGSGSKGFAVWTDGLGHLYWDVQSVQVFDYYFQKRVATTGNGKVFTQVQFYQVSNHSDFANVQLQTPFIDDWSKELSASSKPTSAEYVAAMLSRSSVVYSYPSLSRWIGNIFAQRTLRVFPE